MVPVLSDTRLQTQAITIVSNPLAPPKGLEGAVVAIGNFDGVHRGHSVVIRAAAGRPARQTLRRPDLRAPSGGLFRRAPGDLPHYAGA
jgi:hypothetical protein